MIGSNVFHISLQSPLLQLMTNMTYYPIVYGGNISIGWKILPLF